MAARKKQLRRSDLSAHEKRIWDAGYDEMDFRTGVKPPATKDAAQSRQKDSRRSKKRSGGRPKSAKSSKKK